VPVYPVDRTFAPNGLNQYEGVTEAGEAEKGYLYDANGNLRRNGALGAVGVSTFTYDAENRLVKAEGARNAVLTYDPLGRLSRVWDPTTDAAVKATRFARDGDRLILETSDAGALRHFYVHGNAPDQPLIWWDFTGGNTRRFLHADHQGSIVAVSNGQTGAPMTINTYDPWGVPGENNAPSVNNTLPLRFGYTGQAWIPELKMYYYKARFYYPALGRFLQTDPIGYDDDADLYAYVGNDPINHVDPAGTDAEQAAHWAAAMIGNTDYQKSDFNRQVGGWKSWLNWGAGAPKCNIFVWDALRAGNIMPSSVNGESRMAYVSDWSNRSSKIDGFRPLHVDTKGNRTEAIRVGDVLANKGHVGIIVHVNKDGRSGLTASAADPHHQDRVTAVPFGFRPQDGPPKDIVVWRRVESWGTVRTETRINY